MAGVVQGIQHLGIGVDNHEKSWKWYRKFFGLDVPFFNEEALAPLMSIYTNGEVINKRAAMVMNLKGGCAMEIVQPTSFQATNADREFELGDLGIFIGAFKTPNLKTALEYFRNNEEEIVANGIKTPDGKETFYVRDPNGLLLQVVESEEWYTGYKHPLGGGIGCTIGCSDIDLARKLYSDILGYDAVIYDESGVFDDWNALPGGDREYRRVLLARENPCNGGFNKVSGNTQIELIQDLTARKKHKMYEGRMWGDIGFIHLGFDVRNMKDLGITLEAAGFGFTCDTNEALGMGESTKVHCTYVEDPDGTLIELIEVYKIPIIKKLGIYLNVEKRNPEKPLPDTMLKALKFMRVKD
jgi:catechol 2,3-dioxygenase-like lactoylglutathione lyase family enzyme